MVISKKCDICGKEIEGYNEKHVSYLIKQHKLTHDNTERRKNDAWKKKEKQKD